MKGKKILTNVKPGGEEGGGGREGADVEQFCDLTGCFKSLCPFFNREKIYCFPNCRFYEAMQVRN